MPVSTRSSLSRRMHTMITNGRFSREGHDSTSQPFFASAPENAPVPRNTMTRTQKESLRKLIREIPFDANLLQFYDTFCTEFADATSEFYFNSSWTLMSLYRVMEQIKYYRDNGQADLIDIGFTYGGMGHVVKLCYIPSTHSYIFLFDGGSSGWDREANARSSSNFTPDERTTHHTFDEVIDIFNDEDLDYFSLPVSPYNDQN